MKNTAVGFIGGGRIVRIFLEAMDRAAVWPGRVVVCDADAAVREGLLSRFGNRVGLCSDHALAASQDLVFVALHPPAIAETLQGVKAHVRADAVVVSLAPKLTIQKIRDLLGGEPKVVRMLPNAPSIIGRGYNPVCYPSDLPEGDRRRLGELFAAFGESPQVPESDLEAYALLTGMGPTYFWPQLYALKELGEGFGLEREALGRALEAMLTGTVRTMFGEYDKAEVNDLIPVKPLAAHEQEWVKAYKETLTTLYKKIKP